MPKATNPTNRPIQEYRISNWKVSIWENVKEIDEASKVTYKTVSLSRSFKKKKEDIWRNEVINNIRRQDLTKLRLILNKAEEYLFFDNKEEEEDE
jgi:hypothetical protein